MSFDDELLLTTLGGALERHPAQPSEAELAEFRAIVGGDPGWSDGRLTFPEPVVHRRGRSVLVAAALVVGLVVAGGAAVLAAGNPLPNSLRSPVRALGIPVDDAAVARTRSAMADLRRALEGTDDARVEATALALAARLRSLAPGDLDDVDAPARALLALADARLSRRGLSGVHADTATPQAAAVAPAAEVDDGGSAASSGGDVVDLQASTDVPGPVAVGSDDDSHDSDNRSSDEGTDGESSEEHSDEFSSTDGSHD